MALPSGEPSRARWRWACLPPCSGEPRWTRSRAFLVFDPAVSPHYKVLLPPDEPRKKSDNVEEEDDDARRFMEATVDMDVARVLVKDREVGAEGVCKG
nr:unnamed protein product [Digitaria exilis]